MKKIPFASRILVPVAIILIGIFYCSMFFLGFCCAAIDYAMGHEGRVPVLKLKLKRIFFNFRQIKTEKIFQEE